LGAVPRAAARGSATRCCAEAPQNAISSVLRMAQNLLMLPRTSDVAPSQHARAPPAAARCGALRDAATTCRHGSVRKDTNTAAAPAWRLKRRWRARCCCLCLLSSSVLPCVSACAGCPRHACCGG
jgi:hypothetical protein